MGLLKAGLMGGALGLLKAGGGKKLAKAGVFGLAGLALAKKDKKKPRPEIANNTAVTTPAPQAIADSIGTPAAARAHASDTGRLHGEAFSTAFAERAEEREADRARRRERREARRDTRKAASGSVGVGRFR